MLTAADVHVDGYPTVEAVRWMGRRIEAQTGGRITLRMYHSGQLGRETDVVDLARFGALDIVRVSFAAVNNAFPPTQLFSLPYVFESAAHMRRVVDGPVGREVRDAFSRRGLVGLAIYDAGARSFYNTARAVSTPGELAGLKLRVPPADIFIRLIRAFGANATPLSYGEVYSALQTRLIDGAENNWRSFHSSRQFEVARHWAQTEHSYAPEALLLSRRRFAGLDVRDQEIVLAAAAESVPYMRTLWDRTEATSRAAAIAAGVQVTEVDRAAFERAAAPVLRACLQDADLARLYRAAREAA
ncbi:MAG TPA: TRAP transporter substrate-binding protein [Steroidobacteraceae bacterium]|nr:TRAP transporter substrate-binding protein [Steroidobacteraceae bacterium]